jgi:alkylation response protein AidB-like acyl-CoA dehydrogenase
LTQLAQEVTPMSLSIIDEHVALAGSVRGFLSARGALASARQTLDGPRGELPPFWEEMAKTGWLGLHLPEAVGGQGYGLLELAIVVEELGAVVAPGPFLPTVLVSAVLAELGADQWLPGLADGSTPAALGLGGSLSSDQGLLSGDAGVIPGAATAKLLLLAVGDDLALVRASDADVTTAADQLDSTRPSSLVTLAGVTPLVVLAGGTRTARRLARLLAAAEATGVAHACTAAATDYAKLRVQFGRSIGSFQAVKHGCAIMLTDAEMATAATWDGALRPTTDAAGERELTAAIAFATAVPAAQRCAQASIQIHGGIAFTWEHDAHLYLRRAAALAASYGSVDAALDETLALREAGVVARLGLSLPAEAEAHREAVRAFVAELAEQPAERRQAFYARSGYLVPHWPRPYGLGAGPVEQLVVEQELEGVARPGLGIGEWLVLTLVQAGNDEQRERWTWPSLEGELRWCQLFSEPGAGSDAAAISTKAVRTEGGWLVSGQKVWTSDALHCNRGLATVRTDPSASKHAGISMMAIDMLAKGVDVRPLRELTGDALFNEVFFDEVFVPDADVVGGVGEGWKVARAVLGNERVSIGGGSSGVTADRLLELVPGADLGQRREVGRTLAEGHALRCLSTRSAARAVAGSVGAESSLAKLVSGSHAQRVGELAVALSGPLALVGAAPGAVHEYLFARCLTIAGGTTEILRNVIGERILGLPRET